jgi:hypothetical protein
MTRYLITDPGAAAHPAKNAPAAPGLPNHSDEISERTPMIVSTPVPGLSLVVGALATACDAYDAALEQLGDTEATACSSPAMRAALCAALPRLLDERVVYEPHALNRLVDAVAAREVAARLRERARHHAALADNPGTGAQAREVHRREAAELDALAAREVGVAEGSGPR